MLSRLICVGLLLVFCMLSDCQAAQCPPGSPYGKLSAEHTMCQEDRGTDMPLTAADIQAIVDKHNEVRAAVSPPAANMQKLVWDEDLAKTAAKLARLCVDDHDDYKNRQEPKFPGVRIGQNMAWSSGFSGMMEAISNSHKMGWLDEKAHFTYGQPSDKVVGHYTQMITGDTALIGCGMADCSAVGHKYKQHKVCNYAPGQTSYVYPYKAASSSCSACSGKCDNKLCDCGGKVCVNGGKLNLADCTCQCTNIFSGDTCQTKNCPADKADCAGWYTVDPKPCQFSNVQEDCPNMCGLCG